MIVYCCDAPIPRLPVWSDYLNETGREISRPDHSPQIFCKTIISVIVKRRP